MRYAHFGEGEYGRFDLADGAAAALPRDHLAYEGPWRIAESHATAAGSGARLYLHFSARRVFLVLGASGAKGMVDVALDGRRRRSFTVTEHRLYDVVTLPRRGDHGLTLSLDPGTEAYAFTFG